MRQGTTSTMYYDPSSPAVHNGDTLTGGVAVPISIGNSWFNGQSMGDYIAEIRAYAVVFWGHREWSRSPFRRRQAYDSVLVPSA